MKPYTRLTPNSRPKLSEIEARAILLSKGVDAFKEVAVLARRGYYRDTMGAPGRNDRGIYDDALFIVGPECFTAFNGNTDPSIARPRVAVLCPGVWRYKPGQHGITFHRPGYPYPAFVQAAEVAVMRDGEGQPDIGWFGINIHRGSNTGTSSLGCQTIPPAQWESFRALLNDQVKRAGQKSFAYVLTDEPEQ